MLLMMLASLVLTGVVTFVVSFTELNNRVDQNLSDKAQNVEKIARARSASAGAAPISQFRSAVNDIDPGRHEVMAAFVDGQLAWKIEGNPDEPVLPEWLYGPALNMANPARTVAGSLGSDKDRMRITIRPEGVTTGGSTAFFLIGRDTSDQEERILASIRTYTWVSAGALLTAGLIGTFFAGHLLRPLRRMREATEVVSHEDLSQRVDERAGADDVSQLAHTFNLMLERLDAGAHEQQRFMDDVGHELRTPLTILRGHLELMTQGDAADVAETRSLLLDELFRMQRLVDDLLLLANAQRPEFVRRRQLDVARFTNEVMEKIRVLAKRRWQIDEMCGVVVDADPQRLTQALIQLAANAVKYTDDEATIALGSRVEPGTVNDDGVPGPDTLAVWVRDTGTGIEAQDQDRIFERFGRVETGRGEEGAGLGLAIVTAIAEAHSGRVTVKSAPGQGSTFTLHIPLMGEATAS
jgi:signal transduction histidine kinase